MLILKAKINELANEPQQDEWDALIDTLNEEK